MRGRTWDSETGGEVGEYVREPIVSYPEPAFNGIRCRYWGSNSGESNKEGAHQREQTTSHVERELVATAAKGADTMEGPGNLGGTLVLVPDAIYKTR